MSKLFRLFLFIGLLNGYFIFGQELKKPKLEDLSYPMINEILVAYKTKNFSKVLSYSEGRMKSIFLTLAQQYKNNLGKLPEEVLLFGRLVEEFRIFNTYQKEDQAIVSVLWVLNGNTFNTKKKISHVNYLFQRDSNSNWKIRDSKFVKDYILYESDFLKENFDALEKNR